MDRNKDYLNCTDVVKELLLNAGWHEGRKFNFWPYVDEETKREDISEMVQAVLFQLGGLRIQGAKDGIDFTPAVVEFDPENVFWYSACGAELFSNVENNKIVGSVFNVGRLPEYNTGIFLTQSGHAIVDGDLPHAAGLSGGLRFTNGIAELLEHFLLGIKCEDRLWTYRENGNAFWEK